MDLWDFVIVLVRRWYVTVPLLTLTALAGYLAAAGVERTYTGSASGVFLEPVISNLPADQVAPNPWAQAGAATTAVAVVKGVADQSTQEQVAAVGLSDVYDISLASRSVLFDVTASAGTADNARMTLDHVVQLMTSDLADKQAAYGVPPDQQIQLQMVSGTSVVATRDSLQRVLVVVLGLGAVLTAAVVVSIEALLTRRRQRPVGIRGRWREPQKHLRRADAAIGETVGVRRARDDEAGLETDGVAYGRDSAGPAAPGDTPREYLVEGLDESVGESDVGVSDADLDGGEEASADVAGVRGRRANARGKT